MEENEGGNERASCCSIKPQQRLTHHLNNLHSLPLPHPTHFRDRNTTARLSCGVGGGVISVVGDATVTAGSHASCRADARMALMHACKGRCVCMCVCMCVLTCVSHIASHTFFLFFSLWVGWLPSRQEHVRGRFRYPSCGGV